MKTLLKILGIVILAMTCQSCSLDNDPQDDGNHRLHQDKTRKVYKFKLSLGGDYVDQSEEPLMRASEPNTYVGINVTCKDKTLVDAPAENYAYGVFTSKDDISIDLISGYTYDFEATILRDGTDKYTLYNGFYDLPFKVGQIQNLDPNHAGDLNIFRKSQYNLSKICSGDAFVEMPDQSYLSKRAFCTNPRVNRFYGVLNDKDPEELSESGEIIEIPLDYKCFGLSISVTDIPEGTYLTVKDKNYNDNTNNYNFLLFPDDLEFRESGKAEWEDIYSLNNLTNEEREHFELVFTWHRGVGKEETFNSIIDVGPNIKKKLIISVTGTANKEHTSNIILKENSFSFTNENQNVTHSGN